MPTKKLSSGGGCLEEVTATFRPSESLGAKFDYRNGALIVSGYSGKMSRAKEEGVEIGMMLAELDNVPLLGLPQEQVIAILKSRISNLRHIKFTSLGNTLSSSTATAVPTPTTMSQRLEFQASNEDDERQLQQRRANIPSNLASILKKPPTTLGKNTLRLPGNDFDWEKALYAKPATQTIKSSPSSTTTTTTTMNGISTTGDRRGMNGASSFVFQDGKRKSGSSNVDKGFPLKTANRDDPPQTTTRPTSSSADPHSTPARRRRIVADATRFLLRQYCVKAVKNVIIYRKQTTASIMIQTNWRAKWARLTLQRLRFARRQRAAIVIQKMIRCFLAHCLLLRLRKADYLRRALQLALIIQKKWRERKARIREAERRAKSRDRALRKKHKAALEIQRIYRGVLGRRRAKAIRDAYNLLMHRRHTCAIKIQSHIRRFLCLKRLKRLRRAYKMIGYSILIWFTRLKHKKIAASIDIQRVYRGYMARVLLNKLRIALVAEAEKNRLEALFQRQVQEAKKIAENESKKKLELHVAIDTHILEQMVSCGPSQVTLWSLHHSLLDFSWQEGYTTGSILSQIIGAVEMAFPQNHSSKNIDYVKKGDDDSRSNETKNETKTKCDDSYDVVDVDETERCVKVSKWKDKECKAVPSGSSLPSQWNEVIQSEHEVDFFIEKHERSIKICFERDGCDFLNRRVHVATTSPVTLLSNAEVWLQPRVLTTIVLESSEMDDTGLPCIIKNTSLSLESSTGSMCNDNKGEYMAPNFKFKFKDVSIVMNAPPPPSKGSLEENEDDLLKELDDNKNDDENKDNEFDDFDDSVDSETLNEMESDFVVKVVLQEPDWDLHARIIQRNGRKWAQMRIQAASRIAKWLKSKYMLDKWQELIYETITYMHCHMTVIQKWIRRFIASRHVIRKRQMITNRMLKSIQRTVNFFVDDMSAYSAYLVSEEGNYLEFGMDAHAYNLPYPNEHKSNRRSLETCGVIVGDTYNQIPNDNGRGNMLSTKLLPEPPSGDHIVHPLDHLSVSATTYKNMEEPWNVFQRHDLAFQQKQQEGEIKMKGENNHNEGKGQAQEEVNFLDSLPSVVHRLIGKSLT